MNGEQTSICACDEWVCSLLPADMVDRDGEDRLKSNRGMEKWTVKLACQLTKHEKTESST